MYRARKKEGVSTRCLGARVGDIVANHEGRLATKAHGIIVVANDVRAVRDLHGIIGKFAKGLAILVVAEFARGLCIFFLRLDGTLVILFDKAHKIDHGVLCDCKI
ncbi:hypothetical protein BC940DRAFT_297009 [Gongronella butleri]|nr:hypothetical protein BC940DRAFT_297009 [Gongronella butleri]